MSTISCMRIWNRKNRNRFPLAVLLKVDPQDYQRVKFTSEATVYKINMQKNGTTKDVQLAESMSYKETPLPDTKTMGPKPPQYLEGTTHTFQFHFDTGGTSKRSDFVLGKVFRNATLSLPAQPPQKSTHPAPSEEEPEHIQMAKPSSLALLTTASNQPDIVEDAMIEPRETKSTPPYDQQATTTQKGNELSKLPQLSTRKALFKNNPQAETYEIVKKIKHDD
ncbi:hypothetical protein Tco_0331115 [Tanacetum coccineum]